jgi:hypothetical protein
VRFEISAVDAAAVRADRGRRNAALPEPAGKAGAAEAVGRDESLQRRGKAAAVGLDSPPVPEPPAAPLLLPPKPSAKLIRRLAV